jgi:hypothetical protein
MCLGKSAKSCGVSEADFKAARAAFLRGQRLSRSGHSEEALPAFEEAASLVPRSLEYMQVRQFVRQQASYEHLQRGNRLMMEQRTVEAVKEYTRALELDPGNQYIAQRLRDTTELPLPRRPTWVDSEPDELLVRPLPGLKSFHAGEDTRSAYNKVGATFRIKIKFDDSTAARNVHFDFKDTSFEDAMNAMAYVTRTFWTPLSPGEVLVAGENSSSRKEQERWLLRSFYLPEVASTTELTELINMLRILFEVRFVAQAPNSQTLVVRGPESLVRAATRYLEMLWAGRPQVILDVDVYEVNRQMMRSLGVNLPLQFTVFNISAAALAALGSVNIQQLVNQLIASGGLNGAGAGSSISALLAQLQQQQNSLFQNPVATFGGGLTLMGITVPPATANFSMNDSRVQTLDSVSLRAAQGNAATFRLGSRYPVMSASYSNIANSVQQLSGLIGNGANSIQTTFPAINYEDLGISLKATPTIHDTEYVTLALEMEMRALAGQSINGVPVITNRSYKGSMTLKNGEAAVVAGALSRSEQASLSGVPGFSQIPVLGALTSTRTRQIEDDEFLVVITPYILSAGPDRSGPVIMVPPHKE